MEDEYNRAALMNACTRLVIELMKTHGEKTGTSRIDMLRDIVALPIWITTQVSDVETIEDDMLLTMSSYRQLVKDYESQEVQFHEKAQPYSSFALH
tara:strand:+ start:77 stop:364 length:288 start_codon:yes stop_codon:yes gene_type:complete